MRKKLTLAPATLAVFGLVAAACGSSSTTAGTTTTAAGSSTTAASTASSGGSSTTAAGGSSTGFVTLDQRCTAAGKVTVPADFNVVLVTDTGKVDDGTFNQFAYDGLKAAEKCFSIKTSYIETASQADYAKNIATALEAKPEIIVTVGFLMTDATTTAAKANPTVKFIGVDQGQASYPDNEAGVVYNEDEGGYIVGAMAATLSKSNVIGVVAGRQDVPPVVKYVSGYEAGAKSVKPNIQVLSIYNDSFTDTAKGGSDAKQFIGEGADVIFGAGGQTGSGGVKAATEANVWGIGVDQDEYLTTFTKGTAPGAKYLATSAIKRVDLSVFDNVAAELQGKFKGGAFVLSAANAGITYAPAHDAQLPAAATQILETTRAGLASGSIKTGVCGQDGLFIGKGSKCG